MLDVVATTGVGMMTEDTVVTTRHTAIVGNASGNSVQANLQIR